VKLVGGKDLQKLMEKDTTLGPVIRNAMYSEATVVLNESKRLVPVRTGSLRRSGMVEPPKTQGTRTTVEVTYGGDAAAYALYVHEIPPDSGGRWGTGATHKSGKTFKYLEIPANAHRDKFVRNVLARIAASMKEG
tara:strand:+ start:57 stop:461 length:405 start_codon:yes stop_codon:yes gene_type:complete